MIKVTIIENGKKVDKIVNISSDNIKLFSTSPLDKLGLKEVPLDDVSKTQSVKEPVEEICCICQDSFLIGSQKRTLKCNHFFHDTCIEKWLVTKIKCPLCSKDIA